jgi:hypothetical protein
MTPTPPAPQPALSMRPFVPVCPLAILSSSRAAPPMPAVPLAPGPGRPAPAGGASSTAPAGDAGGGAPVDTLAGTGAPAPTPRASLADMVPSGALARAILLHKACALKADLNECCIARVRTSNLKYLGPSVGHAPALTVETLH